MTFFWLQPYWRSPLFYFFFRVPPCQKRKNDYISKEIIQERDFLNFFNRGVAQPG